VSSSANIISWLASADYATARENLGVKIGTNVQAWDTQLDDIAALVQSDSYIIVGNDTNWVQETGNTARTSLGLGTGDSPGFTSATLGNLVIDDGGDNVTIDSDDQTDGSAAANIPNFTDATADFLMTNNFKVWLPFAIGLSGEDTDGAAANGGGIAGAGSVDVTTHDYNDGAGADTDVHCLVYDASQGAGTWADLKDSSNLDAWAADYQLFPDAASEAVG
ncbi:unnamed protein product, partial [marine sediment metagenome]